MLKEKLLNKPFCIAMLAIGLVYGLALPFFWGNDPTSELGTLSLLCENRKIYFWLWVFTTAGSVLLNTQYMYKKFNYKSKVMDAVCILAFLGMCGVALTLGHSIEDWNPKRVLHWISTGVYIVLTIAAIALFFIINRKKNKHFPLLCVCTLLIFATFAVLFAAMGKSAVMEMVPMALLKIFLFIVNFTQLIKPQTPVSQ